MRELKFRAWVYYGEKLEKPHYSRDYGSLDRFFEDHSENDIDQCIEQYTGLKDKKGKEIYEGDIVKRTKPHEILKNVEEIEIFRIRWGVRKAGFFAYSKERKKHNMPAKRLNANDTYEVIGNIHENPELVKEKE